MPEESTPPIPMNVGQAQTLVEYVENPQNPTGVGLWLWAHYYQAKIYLLQSQLPLSDTTTRRGPRVGLHPRALTAVEFEQYLAREVEYLRERLAYIESKLQQLWQTAGLSETQVRIICEGLELPFTYRELTEMWERGI